MHTKRVREKKLDDREEVFVEISEIEIVLPLEVMRIVGFLLS